jgi:hypothetical protein
MKRRLFDLAAALLVALVERPCTRGDITRSASASSSAGAHNVIGWT